MGDCKHVHLRFISSDWNEDKTLELYLICKVCDTKLHLSGCKMIPDADEKQITIPVTFKYEELVDEDSN